MLCSNCRILPICRARAGGAPRLWHHHCPEPRLYGAGLFRRAVLFGWSRRPIIELVIPSTIDGTLAPWPTCCKSVLPACRAGSSDGSSWDDHRETVADLIHRNGQSSCTEFPALDFGTPDLFPSLLKEHSDLSTAIFSTERSICGKSSRHGPCWATRIIEVRSRVFICAVREAIRGRWRAPVRQATMPLGNLARLQRKRSQGARALERKCHGRVEPLDLDRV